MSEYHLSSNPVGRFLVVGSINMDTILQTQYAPSNDGAVLVTHTSQMPGGHAANCASALTALGATVALVGAVGNDAHGDALIRDLHLRNIDSSYVQILADRPTGEVIIPTFADEHFMLVKRNANDHANVDLGKAINSFNPDALIIFDPSPDLFRQIDKLYGEGNCPIPTYWVPGGINVSNPKFGFMFNICDAVIVNANERLVLELVSPENVLCERWALITTMGSKGSRLQQGTLDLFVPVGVTEVKDSVGAGDAFAAAYVIACHARLPVNDRLAVANSAGAIAVRFPGARVIAEEFLSFWLEPSVAQAFAVREALTEDALRLNHHG